MECNIPEDKDLAAALYTRGNGTKSCAETSWLDIFMVLFIPSRRMLTHSYFLQDPSQFIIH
jgi:hypothetical protein